MRRKLFAFILVFLSLTLTGGAYAQSVGLKTNLLYWGTATPNVGVELKLAPRWTVDLSGGWNPFTINKETGLKWRHIAVAPEARYYLCEAFDGHFFGLHGAVGFFNVNRLNIPFGMFKEMKDYRYQGWVYGAGLTYGYEFVASRHLNIEASISAGYLLFDYTKYDCEVCGDVIGKDKRHYVGPTKATLSLIYLF